VLVGYHVVFVFGIRGLVLRRDIDFFGEKRRSDEFLDPD
jgi:hypothetical protein